MIGQEDQDDTGIPSSDPSGYQPPKPDQPPVSVAPTPPAEPPSLAEEQGLVAALKSYEVQEWLRVLCRMHVLTQQMLLGGLEYDELLPLWAKRMKVLHAPPPLFAGIKLAVTEKGVTWQAIATAKLVAGENGFVAVATGEGSTYTVLDRGSKLQGALSALFGKMWDYPPLKELVEDRNRFMLIATSIKAIYDHTARKMELMARLIIAKDDKHVLVKHNCGDSPTYLQNHPEAATAPTKRQRSQQNRSYQQSRSLRTEPAASVAPEPPYPPPHVSGDARTWDGWRQQSWHSEGGGQSWRGQW